MKNETQLSFSAALAVCPQITDVEVCPAYEPEPHVSITSKPMERIASILHDYTHTDMSVEAIGKKHEASAIAVCHVAKAAGVELRGRGRTRLTEPRARDRKILEWVKTHPHAHVGRRFEISKQRVGDIVKRWASRTEVSSPPPVSAHADTFVVASSRPIATRPQQAVDSNGAWHSVISFRITTEEAHRVDECRGKQLALGAASRSQAARTILLGYLTGKVARNNVPLRNTRQHGLQPRQRGTGGNIVISFRLPESNVSRLDEWLTQEPPKRAASRGQLARQILCDFLAGRRVEAETPVKNAAPVQNQFLTEEDITGDIERLIAVLVIPYVDVSNPMLHFDELQAECRAKVARILHDGVLSKCPTRAKVFAFIKTALKNNIRSLVLKHTFTLKRGGVGPRRAKSKAQNDGLVSEPKRAIVLRLDDSEACVQVGRQDIAPLLFEFLEEVKQALSPQEYAMLDYLLKRSTVNDEDDWPGSASLPSSLSVYGMTQAKFEKLRDRLYSVCSDILRR